MSRRLAMLLGAFHGIAAAQGIITTIAGTDPIPPVGEVPANSVYLAQLVGVAADARGNVYAADAGSYAITKITSEGKASVLAGTGIAGYSGDGGPGRLASILLPSAVAVDSAGNVYVADFATVRRIDTSGVITTIAGNLGGPPLKDGGSASSLLVGVNAIAVGPAGQVYLSLGARIVVVQNGVIKYFAGTGTFAGYKGDGGSALNASFNAAGIAADASGNLYIADAGNFSVRKIDSRGVITSVVGSPGITAYKDDVPGNQTIADSPVAIAVDANGQVYFTDIFRVRVLGSDGIVHLVAGQFAGTYAGDGGPAVNAGFAQIKGVAVDGQGNIFIADRFNHAIRKVDTTGTISTFARSPAPPAVPIPALTALLGQPSAVAADRSGNVYIGDVDAYLVRRVSPDGTIRTVAGNGSNQYNNYDGQPGPATSISVFPLGVAVDSSGILYVGAGTRVLRVGQDGTASAFASGFSFVYGLAFDAQDNLYVADYGAFKVQKVSPSGVVTLFAGSGRNQGDGGKATDAILNTAVQVAAANGNVYVSECDSATVACAQNQRIRVVTPDGLIHTIAGNGSFGYSDDGLAATASSLEVMFGLAVSPAGQVYFSESLSGRVRMIAANGTLKTVAGVKFALSFSGDGGPATAASLNAPSGIAFDAAGNLLIADSANHRVRKVLAVAPAVAVKPSSLAFSAQAGGAPAAGQTISVTGIVPALPFTVSTSASWLQVDVSSGTTPRQVRVIADPATLSQSSYQGTVDIQFAGASPSKLSVTVTFSVAAGQPAQLSADQDSISFTLPRSGGQRQQTVKISNAGGGSFSFSATATTRTGGNWLAVTPTSGTVTARAPIIVTATANAQGLAQGTYSGQIVFDGGAAGAKTVLATLTVSASDQALLLTQAGLSFTTVSGGGLAPPQSFGVKNIGAGTLKWTSAPSTSDGAPWLSLSPPSGASVAGAAAPLVTVTVDHRSLAPKQYYGLARIDGPGAANTPQVVTIHLDVLPPGSDPGAVVQPAELLFTTTPALASVFESAGALEVLVYNLTAAPISFHANTTAGFASLPHDGVVVPGTPARLYVQPQLVAGNVTASGALTLQFDDGTVNSVPLRVATSAATTPANLTGSESTREDAGSCSPTRLLPTISVIGQSSSSVPASWPTGLNVNVQDDCQRPITAGSVSVGFSNGDPSVSLTPIGDGKWQGTWVVQHTGSPITLTVSATDAQTSLTGTAQNIASLETNYAPPMVQKQGVVSTANPVSGQPLAPGSVISIFGQNLFSSATPVSAPAGTLPLSLGDTSVLLGGFPVPLFFASQNQINAVVPWELSTDTQHQLLISRGVTYSDPVLFSVAQAQPAIFLYPQTNAPNQGIFAVYRPNVSGYFLNTPSAPARAGDTLVIYGLGLGTVTNRPATGAPSPSNPLAQSPTPPVLKIGGQAVTVSFSGMSPLFVGLYQVQATLPGGLPSGPTVPVLLEIAGQQSSPVTIALQ